PKSLALFQPLQRFLRHFVLWIQFECVLKFILGCFSLALFLVEAPQPRVRCGRPGITRTHRRFLRIFLQQVFGGVKVFFLQHHSHSPVIPCPWIGRSHALSCFRYREQSLQLAAFHGIVPNVVDQFRRFWMTFQRLREFLIRSSEIFFLPSAIPRRVISFCRVQLRQLLTLRQSLTLPASHH